MRTANGQTVIAVGDLLTAPSYGLKIVDAGGGTVALKLDDDQHYVSVDDTFRVCVDRTTVGPWEKFIKHPAPDGFYLECAAWPGRYLTAEGGGGDSIVADCWPGNPDPNRRTPGAWQTFRDF